MAMGDLQLGSELLPTALHCQVSAGQSVAALGPTTHVAWVLGVY